MGPFPLWPLFDCSRWVGLYGSVACTFETKKTSKLIDRVDDDDAYAIVASIGARDIGNKKRRRRYK